IPDVRVQEIRFEVMEGNFKSEIGTHNIAESVVIALMSGQYAVYHNFLAIVIGRRKLPSNPTFIPLQTIQCTHTGTYIHTIERTLTERLPVFDPPQVVVL